MSRELRSVSATTGRPPTLDPVSELLISLRTSPNRDTAQETRTSAAAMRPIPKLRSVVTKPAGSKRTKQDEPRNTGAIPVPQSVVPPFTGVVQNLLDLDVARPRAVLPPPPPVSAVPPSLFAQPETMPFNPRPELLSPATWQRAVAWPTDAYGLAIRPYYYTPPGYYPMWGYPGGYHPYDGPRQPPPGPF